MDDDLDEDAAETLRQLHERPPVDPDPEAQPPEVFWFWRCREALLELPDLVGHVRSLVVNSDGRGERGDVGAVIVRDGVTDDGTVQLLGLRAQSAPLRVSAVDDLDEVYAQLVSWVLYWAERLGETIPVPVAWANDREVQGFRAGTTVGAAMLLTQSMTLWLLAHHSRIRDDEQGERYCVDFTRAVWRFRARYPVKAGRLRAPVARVCRTCGEQEVRVSWFSEQDDGEVVVRCEHCGWTPDARDVARVLREVG